MNNEKLIVGMPAGSLADPKRGGNIVDLLKQAGFPAKGYDQGGPSTFPLTPFLVGWDGRPQEFGSQLVLNEIDVAIGGDDWITERMLEYKYAYGTEIALKKVLSLKRGQVRIVIIATGERAAQGDDWLKNLLSEKKLVTMVSEMPYLALDWFKRKTAALGIGESHSAFAVQKYRTPPTIEKGIVVYEPWGKTEAKVTSGAVDFAMEITQTGSAIRNYGLSIVDEVLQSEAGIWANPNLKQSPEKYELAKMFLLNLYGSIHAEDKVLLFFNAHKEEQQRLTEYLQSRHLFGDEPTVNEGINFIEFSIELDASNKDLPLAQVRYELAKYGATNIETIPLHSSIPGLHAIEF
jgi:ATP phosphoribosyltransferase